MSDAMNVNSVLNQIRTLRAQTEALRSPEVQPTTEKVNPVTDFGSLLSDSLQSVNQLQKQSGALQTAFEKGDPGVSLPEVMIASQKSSVAFQATIEVRNKMVDAYQEIMRMSV